MASEICASVVSEIVKCFLNQATLQACYPFRFRKYVQDLVKEKENLQLQRRSVQDRVTRAKQEAQEINILVMTWLEKVDTLMADAGLLEEKANTNKSCCLGHCPNWIWRCHLAKQIEEKTKEMVIQGNKCNFEPFAHPAPPPGIACYSSDDFLEFDSLKSTYDQLLQALKDDEVSMIGLYGMGGCGKTTLAQQVGKTTMELFNRVIFVVVSSSIDIQKIQDLIASQLGFKFQAKVEQGRAQELWLRVNRAGNILIILDDVWKQLDFKAIGIPFGSNLKGCKVLLTTRLREVCISMNCQRTIQLNLLSEEEAERLFQHYAYTNNLTPDNLNDLAKEIVHECGGLAIAIEIVASTLKGKNRPMWEEALETLRDPRWMDINERLRDPYKCLRLSYDNLKNEAAKSIFLLCSVFPEDLKFVKKI